MVLRQQRRGMRSALREKGDDFPGKFREIAAVSKQVESQPPVKVDRALDVLYDNLCYELLCRIYVSGHD